MPTKIDPRRSIDDDLAALRQFVKQKQSNWSVVRLNFTLLENQYRDYLNNFARCSKYLNLKPYRFKASANVLRKLYDQKPKCLGYISELRQRAGKALCVCPYCGLPAGKVTLDHYLPRDARAFPHLSIFTFNLVPACFACQLKKGNLVPTFRLASPKRHSHNETDSPRLRRSRIGSQKGRETFFSTLPQRHVLRFLHPYFDKFLEEVVWRLEPRDHDRALDTLTLVPGVRGSRKAALVRFHIRKLGIQERSRVQIAHLVRQTVESFRLRKVTNLNAARSEAQILLNSALEKDLTPNSIHCTFLRAIRDHSSIAKAIVQKAQVAPPTKKIKSRAVRL